MLSYLSHLPTNLADLPYLRGFQGRSARKRTLIGTFSFASEGAESLNESTSFISETSPNNDFNRPLKRSLSKAVVEPFGWAVKSKPEAHTLAEQAI